jgi:hypothetical protein
MINTTNRLLIISALLGALVPSLARAQATRTWVSGVGDDANPGSRTAPCKTFAGAISKTLAGGVIDVMDPGGFGAVTITKSITLEGDAAEGGILVAGTHGIVISAGATDTVILRNLTFEGLSGAPTTPGLSAIQILSAGSVHIENCHINGFSTSGIGFLSSVSNSQVFIKDTTIHNCLPAGINLAPTAPATAHIERVDITDCGDGIDTGPNAKAVVLDTTASGGSGVGFLVGTNAQLTLYHVNSCDNQIGVESSGLAVVCDSTIANNSADGFKHTKPGKIQTSHNNRLFGNNPNGAPTSMLAPK